MSYSQDEERECNIRLIREVAEEQQILISQVESIIGHYSHYIANTIRAGGMEGVFVPYLGKFQVKLDNQQYKAYLHSLHPVFKKMFQQNATSEQISELLTKPTHDG